MDLNTANIIIGELVELSDTKYSFLKVGRDTLNTDILFIEKYEQLKQIIGSDTFDDINMKQLPNIKILKELVGKISDLEQQKQDRNVRMTKATQAYQKK